ncbi:CBPC6-like protein [Mya arenaria]|uniref:CBPC6-like protein n=1 Tax=Mya arenaria TaxID=6604 RepID=A0ABY7FQ20_MYAAR|nr:CBPC6-like protein [Mya arenaria]
MADKKADSGSESDSTEEPVVGNVNKFAVVPPGFTGRPKKGHLIFDACFECGNLGRVDYITEFEYDLFIRPDTCNPRFRRVIFNIVNFSKTKSLYREGMSPFVKSTSRPKCPDHRKNYVMSFAFVFDRDDDVYQFSYCYPYSYTRLQNYLDNLEKRNMDFFTRELLCLTVQQRRLDLITITHPDNLYPEETKRIVFLTARVHPGETPASFVCQGFMDFLIGNHPVAKTLREHIVFKIVPMLNPDGVYLGNYRCSLMGFDLNHFFIDLHAHSTLMNGFMYGNTFEDIDRYERQSVFPKLLCGNAEDFSLANTNFNRDAVKAGTGRRTLGGCLDDNSHCYTLEVSFYSYQTSSTGQAMPYTEEGYMKLGRNLARTFIDYYKLAGVVSQKPSSSIVPKPGAYRIRDRNQQDRSETAYDEK